MADYTDLEEAIYHDYRVLGGIAFRLGHDVTECPVVSPGSPQYEGWIDGWNENYMEGGE